MKDCEANTSYILNRLQLQEIELLIRALRKQDYKEAKELIQQDDRFINRFAEGELDKSFAKLTEGNIKKFILNIKHQDWKEAGKLILDPNFFKKATKSGFKNDIKLIVEKAFEVASSVLRKTHPFPIINYELCGARQCH